MNNGQAIRLRVPKQDLEKTSYFDNSEESIAAWLDALPMANLGQTTRYLYQALSELNRVRLLPAKRLSMLEKLRPAIYFVSRALTKHYLNQPIILPEKARRVATLAHTLHNQLATAYTLVATHTAALGKNAGVGKPEQVVAHSLHRAITDHTQNLLRHYQLYEPIESNVWYNLHQFYILAKQYQILHREISDRECGNSHIEGAYIRALLLGCAKSNQLRQEDFTGLFPPLASWTAKCQLRDAGKDGQFLIDPRQDKPAIYSELFSGELTAEMLSLDTSLLAQHLQELLDKAQGKFSIQDGEHTLSCDLLTHVAQAWTIVAARSYKRIAKDSNLELCIGISATHHFISGQISFEALIDSRGVRALSSSENPFLTTKKEARQKDVWDAAFDSGRSDLQLDAIEFNLKQHEQSDQAIKSKYKAYVVPMVNASANGYCVRWPRDISAQIKAGEILGIKEQQAASWSIAVVRWVGHHQEQDSEIGLERISHPQIGMELISPSATAYGARIINKTGDPSDYQRVLILPEIPLLNRPITLLTPRYPFREGQKVILNQRGREVMVQLSKKLNRSGAYNQFEFRRIGENLLEKGKKMETKASDENKDDFDSLWNSL